MRCGHLYDFSYHCGCGVSLDNAALEPSGSPALSYTTVVERFDDALARACDMGVVAGGRRYDDWRLSSSDQTGHSLPLFFFLLLLPFVPSSRQKGSRLTLVCIFNWKDPLRRTNARLDGVQ
mmetsp:Transcript_6878/g.10850  ORF Transcript_6878/g.10850 Transcript_6878/m.10850 type:complete len:121 (+) Transcript_6878:13-375(+)